MSYRHPRWYDYGKSDAQLEREDNCLMVMLLLFVLVPVVLIAIATH